MADRKVVKAKTTEKAVRLDDKMLKKLSDKAWELRLRNEQALIRKVLEEYFEREEEVKTEKKYSPSVTIKYSNTEMIKKVVKAAAKKDKYLDEENLAECFSIIVDEGLKVEELEKTIKSQQQQIKNLEYNLANEKRDHEFWRKRAAELTFGKNSQPTEEVKKRQSSKKG